MMEIRVRYSLGFMLLVLMLLTSPMEAAINQTGNVTPPQPWTSSTDAYIGNTGSGTLNVNGGSQLSSSRGYLGNNAGTTGTATVTGAGSQWTNSTDLYVGRNGSGALTIEAGGQVSNTMGTGFLGNNSGSTGTATVTGAGSKWNAGAMYVGNNGNGTLNIDAGGQVSNATGFVGIAPGSTGRATVGGVGSQWTNTGALDIGRAGNGSLAIESGGQVGNTFGYLGNFAGATGTATVTGVGSKWTSTNTLYVGRNGSGSLTIEAGGRISNTAGFLGSDSGSTGTATVTGAGSKWTNSSGLYVGNSGSGTLNIMSGALVSVFGALRIDTDLNNDSFVNMATGGMLALKGMVDDSLSQFLGIVQGTDAIRYWDHALLQWSPLTSATLGTDYTLSYITTGDLSSYTLLTVGSISTVGDYDGDDDVDGRDFLILQRNPGLGSVSDWQANYGSSELTAASTSVPEPNALALAISLAAACSFARRRYFLR
jgi:T5SS/PEP-CTERM-associated repeat protein